MAKANPVLGDAPVVGVSLELTVEEAEAIQAITRAIGGVSVLRGHGNKVSAAIGRALGYDNNLVGPSGIQHSLGDSSGWTTRRREQMPPF